MSVGVYSEWLSAFGADRARALVKAGVVDRIYALMSPDQAAVQSNRAEWEKFDGLPMWAWINARPDQAADVAAVRYVDSRYNPAGYLLDIEGEWTKMAALVELLAGVAELGKPIVASLAGYSASHRFYDYRALDSFADAVSWQAYFDSGEGPDPATAVRELYASSFVLPGWQYRHRLGSAYGWGLVREAFAGYAAFDSFRRPGKADAHFTIGARPWGYTVVDRVLWRGSEQVGLLMGRAAYSSIRVSLDVTRGFNDRRSPDAWKTIAATARIPGSKPRPIDVYLAEHSTDAVLAGLAS